MQIPLSVRETLYCALSDHEDEFYAKSKAFSDYTEADIAAFQTEAIEARDWLDSLEAYIPDEGTPRC